MFSKILFCSDLYPSTDYVFASALDLADRSEAELIVLHVLESRNRYSGHVITENGEVWGSREVYENLEKKIEAYYRYRTEKEKWKKIRFLVSGGTPWAEILKTAREEGADLIVMGPFTMHDSRNPPGCGPPRIGINARNVSLKAPCPVNIVTPPKFRKDTAEA